ncbi:hypothetical protein Baya_8222 [Bagarius yarrelli]|uniref:Uncharacterized protein n=1 Tax=Bagarius yarrelli TaxID=175774 RepID=A0A556U5I2_BAGYA|nr:hypothetical protein Baya_8222 [Bagarius yarrelli]
MEDISSVSSCSGHGPALYAACGSGGPGRAQAWKADKDSRRITSSPSSLFTGCQNAAGAGTEVRRNVCQAHEIPRLAGGMASLEEVVALRWIKGPKNCSPSLPHLPPSPPPLLALPSHSRCFVCHPSRLIPQPEHQAERRVSMEPRLRDRVFRANGFSSVGLSGPAPLNSNQAVQRLTEPKWSLWSPTKTFQSSEQTELEAGDGGEVSEGTEITGLPQEMGQTLTGNVRPALGGQFVAFRKPRFHKAIPIITNRSLLF